MKTPDESQYHYWPPVFGEQMGPHGTRHAFKGGRKWDGRRSGTSVCGAEDLPMAGPSEVDWLMAPTCMDCHAFLKGEQSWTK
ncbi:hypothetical protein FHX42_001929 [Saccharopolyspora lacisalsi]|uniref:Uncharacterized protein n=1 Tax=Halosaccharopolyspora lacisalsi TaxID=1000566 RepID=A0A839DRH4_9PSEU|nr:hypothetical protein [Halosaccharopolyspora lacisalsi]